MNFWHHIFIRKTMFDKSVIPFKLELALVPSNAQLTENLRHKSNCFESSFFFFRKDKRTSERFRDCRL